MFGFLRLVRFDEDGRIYIYLIDIDDIDDIVTTQALLPIHV